MLDREVTASGPSLSAGADYRRSGPASQAAIRPAPQTRAAGFPRQGPGGTFGNTLQPRALLRPNPPLRTTASACPTEAAMLQSARPRGLRIHSGGRVPI